MHRREERIKIEEGVEPGVFMGEMQDLECADQRNPEREESWNGEQTKYVNTIIYFQGQIPP